MSDFARVVKYLDLRRAARDEAINTKPLTLAKSREIKKVRDSILLPATLTNAAGVPPNYDFPRILFQFNVTVGYEFSFVLTPSETLPFGHAYVVGGLLFVKWRVGSTVFRYRIEEAGGVLAPFLSVQYPVVSFFFNNYGGERIPSNCVFEFWSNRNFPIGNVGLVSNLTLKLSRLRNPAFAEDVGTVTQVNAALDIDDIGVTYPAALPYTQDNQVWLDNP